MRENKFRAWDEELGKMYDGEEMETRGDLKAWLSYGKLCIYRIEFSEYVELKELQYTGLTDKNGVEIYEGDILRVWQEDEHIPNRDSGGGIIDYDREEGFVQIGIVGFTGCSFDYETKKTIKGQHKEYFFSISWLTNFEIIGNIYENPELLEENK